MHRCTGLGGQKIFQLTWSLSSGNEVGSAHAHEVPVLP
jgi:hypothetical protein